MRVGNYTCDPSNIRINLVFFVPCKQANKWLFLSLAREKKGILEEMGLEIGLPVTAFGCHKEVLEQGCL